MAIPIEVVVIRPAVSRSNRDLVVARPHRVERFSAAQQDDLGMMIEAVREPARRQLLLALATGGRANVGTIIDRTGIDRTTISHHLSKLKLIGLVHSRRQGKHVCYECAPGRVRADYAPGRAAAASIRSAAWAMPLSGNRSRHR